MQKASLIGAMALVIGLWGSAQADEYIRGYTRHNGTYVQPHYQTPPNNNAFDNYSSKPNLNPYTGKKGTVDPYRQPSSGSGFGRANERGY